MIFIVTTVPSLASARRLSKILLDKKLAACVSIAGAVESHYVWKGRRERTREYFCWVKTRKALKVKAEQLIKNNHPYEVPEIVTIPISHAYKPYLKWVYGSTKI